jgi:hypothetical protein
VISARKLGQPFWASTLLALAVVLGVVFIVTVMCIPGGLMGMISRLTARMETGAATRSGRHQWMGGERTRHAS